MTWLTIPSADTNGLPHWWKALEDSHSLQLYSNYGLGAAYALIGTIALVQLTRIQLRVPEYGWTTQKVFHLLNFFVACLRAGVFLFRREAEALHPTSVRLLLFDLPGLLFFTTYTLLVLFWAEIYYQARSLPTSSLRPMFVVMNLMVYIIQFALWTYSSFVIDRHLSENLSALLSAVFLAAVSVSAAAGFLLYGGRLYLMLRRFPIESRGRRKKLREVGLVTTICAACFSIRAVLVALSIVDKRDLSLDMVAHPLLNLIYYTLVEIVPAAWVLFILRKLPPKRHVSQPPGANYQPIGQEPA